MLFSQFEFLLLYLQIQLVSSLLFSFLLGLSNVIMCSGILRLHFHSFVFFCLFTRLDNVNQLSSHSHLFILVYIFLLSPFSALSAFVIVFSKMKIFIWLF